MEQNILTQSEIPPRKNNILTNPKNIGLIIIILIGLLIGITEPLNGLSPLGHHIVAVVIIALGLWIFKPNNVPFMAGCAFIVSGGLIFGLKYGIKSF